MFGDRRRGTYGRLLRVGRSCPVVVIPEQTPRPGFDGRRARTFDNRQSTHGVVIVLPPAKTITKTLPHPHQRRKAKHIFWGPFTGPSHKTHRRALRARRSRGPWPRRQLSSRCALVFIFFSIFFSIFSFFIFLWT